MKFAADFELGSRAETSLPLLLSLSRTNTGWLCNPSLLRSAVGTAPPHLGDGALSIQSSDPGERRGGGVLGVSDGGGRDRNGETGGRGGASVGWLVGSGEGGGNVGTIGGVRKELGRVMAADGPHVGSCRGRHI